MELQADVAYSVVVIAQLNPLLQSTYEPGPQRILVGGAKMEVSHVGIQVCLPLGVEGICIDSGTDVIQLHFRCIADVDAVDLDRGEQQQEGKQHVHGQYDEDGEIG